MRAPHQEGEFPFPVKYGYAAVGLVVDGPSDFLGKRVFALHPHQTRFAVRKEAAVLVPDEIPARRGILAANMETALNAFWDGAPAAGDKIVVVGAGAVGLLVASLAACLPGAEVIVCDINPARASVVQALGAAFALPEALGEANADVVFHTSATGAGLASSLRAAGFEARIVELSWYGAREIGVHLGSEFHSKRLKLVSSQVGSVAEARRSRWTYARRLAKAVALLADDRLDALITDEVAFDALPERMASILDRRSQEIVTAIRYD
jgi:threonine dehydrogenase-like Zn-dependent dehydrogenase